MYFGAAIQPILNPGAIVLEKEPNSNVLESTVIYPKNQLSRHS
jgi:hypothetical protein